MGWVEYTVIAIASYIIIAEITATALIVYHGTGGYGRLSRLEHAVEGLVRKSCKDV